MKTIYFFSGVPINDAAEYFRAGVLARQLRKQGIKVKFLSVSFNYKKSFKKQIRNLPVWFIGQAHYFSPKPFSKRIKINIIKLAFENIKTIIRTTVLFVKKKPDLLVLITPMPICLLVGLVAKILGIKVIIDIDDLAYAQMQASGYSKIISKLYGFIEVNMVKLFDKVIVCSRFLQSRYKNSVIIPNMINWSFWHQDKKEKRVYKQIAFVGQIGYYHGQLQLLKSFKNFLENNRKLKLVFIGGGEKQKDLEFLIQKFKLQKQVKVTGHIEQKKVRGILKNSDIGILPMWDKPLYKARQPLKLLEYMAAGLAIVSGNVGEVKKIIQENYTGLLCPAGNLHCLQEKIEYLYKNKKKMFVLQNNAIKASKNYLYEKILPQWYKVLGIN
jgi:glycosyltransferase involved in cell wall biosynthesis